jgi:hypothetical protein
MAVLALIVADNQYRRREAETIAEVVENLASCSPREDTEKFKARLIYNTAFGDLDRAVDFGTRLIEAERRSGNSAALLRALRWVSLPLRLTNDRLGAISALKEAFQQASRLRLRGEMWNAAFYLQGVALDCEDLDLALEWAPIVAGLGADATAHTLASSDQHYTQARIDYMRGEFEEARIHLSR